MRMLRIIVFVACCMQSTLLMSNAFYRACSSDSTTAYPARYGIASFWAAQTTGPLLDALLAQWYATNGAEQDDPVATKEEIKARRDQLLVPIKSLHRSLDLIAPHLLAHTSIDRTKVAWRSGNIVIEELSLYGLKRYIGPSAYTCANGKIKIRKVAAWRIVHKGLFKVIDTAIHKEGDMVAAGKSGVRASLSEAAYVGVTQAVHNVPLPDAIQSYIELFLPHNAYPHTFLQHMTKLAVTSVASVLAACVV